MIHETQFSGPSDMLAMCDLTITLRKNALGTEHSGDLNWAAYMHAQMNPQRDTRLWWDGAALAAWATSNKYGLTFALSYAQRENLDLLRRISVDRRERNAPWRNHGMVCRRWLLL